MCHEYLPFVKLTIVDSLKESTGEGVNRKSDKYDCAGRAVGGELCDGCTQKWPPTKCDRDKNMY